MSALCVLGIETSCDETAAAVLKGVPGAVPEILSEVTLSQIADHEPYGGVVPEVAARAHLAKLDWVISEAMAKAALDFASLDAIAATAGPGLIGGVIVGLTTAKALALATDRKLIGVNHLEGHALSVRLVSALAFPYLLLLVSGGHCQILVVEGVGRYRQLGTTIDDAAGEAFDKAAKLLDLGYPGGPEIERAALLGDPDAYDLPRPMAGRAGCDFSFSGLKTALRHLVERHDPITDGQRRDLAAAFQAAVADCLADRVRAAAAMVSGVSTLVVAGGVAANATLRKALEAAAAAGGLSLISPPANWCTDNAAMIALAGIERAALGLFDGFDLPARPRWPLDPKARRIAHNRAQRA